MAWFKVDDQFWSHPKVMSIPKAHRLAVVGLWTIAGTWAAQHLRDGRIPAYMLDEWRAEVSQADMLVESGLWLRDGDDYVFHDWLDQQPSRTETLAAREKERLRKEEYRRKKAGVSGESPTGREPSSAKVSQQPDPTRPGPTPSKEKTSPPAAEEFEKFWSVYPRKEGKGDARKAFTAARKKTDLATILDGVRRYNIAVLMTEKQFVKMAGPWLRAERWDDETVTTSSPSAYVKSDECHLHPGYPLPCAKCDREAGENPF